MVISAHSFQVMLVSTPADGMAERIQCPVCYGLGGKRVLEHALHPFPTSFRRPIAVQRREYETYIRRQSRDIGRMNETLAGRVRERMHVSRNAAQ